MDRTADNLIQTSGIMDYWPLFLVGLCGVVLVLLALLSLLLLRGRMDFSGTRSPRMAVGEKEQASPPVTLAFCRIGVYHDIKTADIVPSRWHTVGSGQHADFCLDAADSRLASVHFRMRLEGQRLIVSSEENQTFVNGAPIQKLGRVVLRSGDTLRAGSHEYRVMFPWCGEEENTI